MRSILTMFESTELHNREYPPVAPHAFLHEEYRTPGSQTDRKPNDQERRDQQGHDRKNANAVKKSLGA